MTRRKITKIIKKIKRKPQYDKNSRFDIPISPIGYEIIKKSKIKLISASFGDSESISLLNKQSLIDKGVTLAIYNDKNFISRQNSMHSRLKSKIPKMLEWLNDDLSYDYYIWIDSKFTISGDCLELLLSHINSHDICLFRHPQRTSISSELEFVQKYMQKNSSYLVSRYQGEDMKKQVDTYLADKSFNDNSLFACGCFVYSKNLVKNKNDNLMKEWFFHNTIYSVQDQLSLPYLLHKYNTNYSCFNFGIFDSALLTRPV